MDDKLNNKKFQKINYNNEISEVINDNSIHLNHSRKQETVNINILQKDSIDLFKNKSGNILEVKLSVISRR